MAKPKVAVVLSGCGVYDGSEIHEAVLTMLAIVRKGGTYQCFAPNIPQNHVINHLTGQEDHGATRNVLIEAARIARGNIKDLREFRAAEYDAIMFPGGFGAAKNLCTFALDGPECHVNSDVERAIREVHDAGKPIGALCISPALITRVLGDVTVTIGDAADVAAGIESMGGTHKAATHGQVVMDRKALVASTPCYMLDATIDQIATGAENVVDAVFSMITAPAV
ncbi:MAG: isoprenoid biosynthesis glyoxalase ElbB [Rhodospirillaceae bacterium]